MDLFENINVLNPHETWKLIKCGTDEESIKVRTLCNELYDKFSPYSDSDFVNKFQLEFFPKFWEMDLACVLMGCRKKLSETDSGDEGPDICIDESGKKVWVEAICPDRGHTLDSICKPVEGKAMSIESEKIILRITGSIYTKYKKHLKYIENRICSENDPYVIAINSCLLTPGPGLDDLTPRIVKAVFEGGNDVILFDKGSGKLSKKWCENREHLEKHNKEKISLGYFMQEKYSNISAILYSESSYAARPTENGGDYILVHNPFAKNPLNLGFFEMGLEYSANISSKNKEEKYSLAINNYRKAEYLYSEL